jgi:origin recognition complex subunit 1
VLHQHLVYTSLLVGDGEPTRRPSAEELAGVRDALVAARALLVEEGPAAARRPPDAARCMLNLEAAEVERVLGEVGGQRWKAALAV